jgi:lantibiotic modifying enzyme
MRPNRGSIRAIAVAALLTLWPVRVMGADSNRWKQDAHSVARWVRTIAVDTEEGRYWPADALSPSEADVELGDGTAGVVLFWIAMHRAEPHGGFLEDVRRGADYLAAHARTSIDPAAPGAWTTGLYGPIAGSAFALHEAYKLTGDERHRNAALRLVELLHSTAQRDAAGASWGNNHDVLSGAAGTGLFLLYAAREMGHTASGELAAEAGRKLLRRAVPDSRGGITWKVSYESRFVLPNFSHGTAGIAYFLASLYELKRDPAFLDGALAGAAWLETVGDRSDDGFRVFYGWPDARWERRYDIGWAHGPAGTARLFFKLWKISGEQKWLDLVKAGARSLRNSGLPVSPKGEYGKEFDRTQRFGTAGVVRFFLDLYATTGERADLDFAIRLADDIRGASIRQKDSLKWASKRYGFMERPNELAEFSGYFYGAAGYGLMLLGVDGAIEKEPWTLRLPDDPFGSIASKSSPLE